MTSAAIRACMHSKLQPTFFSMEQSPKRQPNLSARLTMSASIHSDFPELGTPVMIVSSPGTTCITPSASCESVSADACTHQHASSPSLAQVLSSASVFELPGQLAHHALLPVSGSGLADATTACLAQAQRFTIQTLNVQARIQTIAAKLAQYPTTQTYESTHPVDLIQGLPAGGLAHLVTKLQIVQTPHILLKV